MNEVSTVKWYIDVMEDGKDVKEIVKLYGKLKDKHKKLKEQFKITVKDLEARLDHS